jgi:hypothetical protein
LPNEIVLYAICIFQSLNPTSRHPPLVPSTEASRSKSLVCHLLDMIVNFFADSSRRSHAACRRFDHFKSAEGDKAQTGKREQHPTTALLLQAAERT